MKKCRLMIEVDAQTPADQAHPLWALASGMVGDEAGLCSLASLPEQLSRSCRTMKADEPDSSAFQQRICDGIVATRQALERQPEIDWICRASISRVKTRYNLNASNHGSGFIYYAPDPATLRGYRVAEEDRELYTWVRWLQGSGIGRVWIHNPDAASRASGLDLEMLEIVRAGFSGEIWISGGAETLRHLENLAAEQAADALVLTWADAEAFGAGQISAALRPQLAVAPPQETRVCGQQPV